MVRRSWIVAVLAFGLISCAPVTLWAQPKAGEEVDHLVLGNPSGLKATTNKEDPDPDEHLMIKPLFSLSYNSKKGTPNWVSWRLVGDDTGKAPRKNAFHSDDDLPEAFFKVKYEKHYGATGFDSGHMCPNADRNINQENARATFVMTNMVPQSPVLNRNSWKLLELHCRNLAIDGKELYIISGPAGKGGTGKVKGASKNVFRTTLADGNITVPSHCWKVILILEPGDDPPAKRITKETELFAVIMHNDMTPKTWEDHKVPVSDVEELTGYKFFSEAPKKIIDALKKKEPEEARRFNPAPFLARQPGAVWLVTRQSGSR